MEGPYGHLTRRDEDTGVTEYVHRKKNSVNQIHDDYGGASMIYYFWTVDLLGFLSMKTPATPK